MYGVKMSNIIVRSVKHADRMLNIFIRLKWHGQELYAEAWGCLLAITK